MTRDEAIHEQARVLAAEAVDADLAPNEAAWLEAHLAACPGCLAVATEYQANRAELAGLAMPEPPRDLWARTQARLDAADARGGPSRSRSALSRSRGSLIGSMVAVVAVVALAGASLLSQSPIAHPGAPTDDRTVPIALVSASTGQTAGNGSTSPLAVVNGTTYWISGGNGFYEIKGATSSCDPANSTCTVSSGDGKTLGTIASQTSVSAAIAPNADVAAVWTADKVAIVPLTDSSKSVSLDQMTPQPTLVTKPAPTPATPAPTATPTPATTPAPTATPTPTTTASVFASASLASITPLPSETVTPAPTETPAPTATPAPTVMPAATPSAQAASGGPVAILSGYEIVGRDPEFSADGRLVAFAARPSDHSTGADVFVWQDGDRQAHAITTSHSALFAGWFGAKLLISEIASPQGSAGGSDPVSTMSYVFDPTSGQKLRIDRPMLMPSVDPTGTYLVYWAGRVEFDPTLGMWQAGGGELYFDRWANLDLVSADAPIETSSPTPTATTAPTAVASAIAIASVEASVSPTVESSGSASASPLETASPSASAVPSPTVAPTPVPAAGPQRLPVAQGSGVVRTWQVRWDATGPHLATWVADKGSSKIGRLSLFSIDTKKHLVDADGKVFAAERVLAAIQLDNSHLVYTLAVDGQTYVQDVPSWQPSTTSTGEPPASAPVTTDRPGN